MATETEPHIQLRPWSVEPFWRDDLGISCWSWARRSGKSFAMAAKALSVNMNVPGSLNLFLSASVRIGGEFLLKEAQVWQLVQSKMRKACAEANLKMESNADGLDLDGVADLFEHSKLETKIWHDRTRYSRSLVVAANPATAVGWGGNIFVDEFGRIEEFKDVLEAILPFIDENPHLFCVMASTPPPDDAHYSYELTCPPHEDFPVKSEGNWYTSRAGMTCHRVTVYDWEAAGFPLFDSKTRKVVTPEQHREAAFDKVAWDRNYAVKYVRGGSSAIGMLALHEAMQRGMGRCACTNITDQVHAA